MTLKKKQWKIDRAYNLSNEGINRTLGILSCLKLADGKDEAAKSEAISLAEKQGFIKSVDRYDRSTATGLRCYGLIERKYDITDVSRSLLNNEISFSEMIILQLIKKEYKYDEESDVIHPFVVFLKVLLLLYESDKSNCWLDCFDYQNFLTEIRYNNEIDKSLINKIIESRNSLRKCEYPINDFDIWANIFLTSGLIIKHNENVPNIEAKYSINESELELIKFIVENIDNLEIINEYLAPSGEERVKILREYGRMDNGLFKLMPEIIIGDYKEIKCEFDIPYKLILEAFLFEGCSKREIDKRIFNYETNGFFSQMIIDSLGLKNEHKGVFAPFIKHKNFIKFAPKYNSLKDIKRYLFEGDVKYMNEYRVENGKNVLFFGIPGCGKSYKVNSALNYERKFVEVEELLNITKPVDRKNIFRTTFYLDYSNADFIGQLLPNTDLDKKVYYEKEAGPFTKALERAYETSEMVYLIIEEINRGNAAAIFGDCFQLLDRIKPFDKKDNNKIGDSAYPITNGFIEAYLGIERGQIIIPSNLTIIATMNTSDQNVFPLDTAFKRRWTTRRLTSDFVGHNFADLYIPYTNITWENFASKINKAISDASVNGYVMEDKKLGAYFADELMFSKFENKDTLCDDNNEKLNRFFYNVVDYLYNDVTKFDHEIIFNTYKIKHNDALYDALEELKRDHSHKAFVEIFNIKLFEEDDEK